MEVKSNWIKIKETLKKGFASHTPNSVAMNENLHQSSKTVFCIINSFCFSSKDKCKVSQALIAYLANLSIKSVSRAVKELQTQGHIKIQHSKGECCTYIVVEKFAQNIENEIRKRIDQAKEFINEKKNKKNKNYKEQKQSNWSNLENQRNYDYDDLEKKLLGWNEPTVDRFGVEYQQMCLT